MSAADRTPIQLLLAAAQDKSAALVTHLHPVWVQAAWRRAGEAAASRSGQVPARRQSLLLADAFGLRWPPLRAFARPAHRIALLGRPQILQVLAGCALQLCRDGVRRSVGREVQGLLLRHVGEPACQQLIASPPQGLSDVQALQPGELDIDRLAAIGYRALCTQGAWDSRPCLAMTRMSLAPSALGAAAAVQHPPPSAADVIVDRLAIYFPELAWLFGSDMDLALSA